MDELRFESLEELREFIERMPEDMILSIKFEEGEEDGS